MAIPKRLRLLVSGVFVLATIAGAIATLFADAKKFYRDGGGLDTLLGGGLAAVGDRLVSVFAIVQRSTFVQIVEELLDVSGASIAELEVQFIRRELGLAPEQVQKILDGTTKELNPFNLRLDGWANLFFVVHDGHLVIVDALWYDDRWHVYAADFGYAREWCAGNRVVFGNSLLPL